MFTKGYAGEIIDDVKATPIRFSMRVISEIKGKPLPPPERYIPRSHKKAVIEKYESPTKVVLSKSDLKKMVRRMPIKDLIGFLIEVKTGDEISIV